LNGQVGRPYRRQFEPHLYNAVRRQSAKGKPTGPQETLDVVVLHGVSSDQPADASGSGRLSQDLEQSAPQSHPTPVRVDGDGDLYEIFAWPALITCDPDPAIGRVESHESESPLIVNLDQISKRRVIEHWPPTEEPKTECLGVRTGYSRSQRWPVRRQDGADIDVASVG
jgi:hypothetical protein